MSSTPRTGVARRYGPDVGEPPLLFDPRRWGSLVGLAGGLVFVFAYAPSLGAGTSAVAQVAAAGLAIAALLALYARPVALGPLGALRPLAMAVYLSCVVGELALIALGTRALVSAERDDLQPALIAAVVGLHFLPMGWAFAERMFGWLGAVVASLGLAGLLLGWAGVDDAADGAGVLAGLSMLVVIGRYGRGGFAPTGGPPGT